MKKLLKKSGVLLFLFLTASVLLSLLPAHEAQAAPKNGLVYSKASKAYFYYEDGQKVKNDWRQDSKGRRYYLGPTGAAYAAEKYSDSNTNIVVKKIGKKYYGFNNKGQMAKGVSATYEGKIYFFHKKTGVYSPSQTKKYRKAAKYLKDASALKKLLGKPKRIKKGDSCFRPNGTDLTYVYKNLSVILFRDDNTGKEQVLAVYPS